MNTPFYALYIEHSPWAKDPCTPGLQFNKTGIDQQRKYVDFECCESKLVKLVTSHSTMILLPMVSVLCSTYIECCMASRQRASHYAATVRHFITNELRLLKFYNLKVKVLDQHVALTKGIWATQEKAELIFSPLFGIFGARKNCSRSKFEP